MSGSPESVSNKHARGPAEHTLIVSVNWIGDTIMAMGAVQAYRAKHPDHRITVLAKSAVQALWRFHAAADDLLPLETGWAGTRRTIQRVRAQGPFTCAYVLPHSFRSAWIPLRAGIPRRIGLPGPLRRFLLTDIVRPDLRPGRIHQSFEYLDLLVPGPIDRACPLPCLQIPEAIRQRARKRLAVNGETLIAFVPGAARGPSKQWPPERFAAVGRKLLEQDSSRRIVVSGSAAEVALCEQVATAIGHGAESLAGRTGIDDWIALLGLCDAVVANDSGAMHVAAALGTPVVAIFGITDPATTGPTGPHAHVLQHSTRRCRDVPRVSREADTALAAVTVDEVAQAVEQALTTGRAQEKII
jgi:heptosyltransferase II